MALVVGRAGVVGEEDLVLRGRDDGAGPAPPPAALQLRLRVEQLARRVSAIVDLHANQVFVSDVLFSSLCMWMYSREGESARLSVRKGEKVC